MKTTLGRLLRVLHPVATRRGRIAIATAALGLATALVASSARAQTYLVLHDFEIPPYYAFGGLVADAAGNLYGTSEQGGAYSYGTVFKLDSSGSRTTLYSFNSSDGANPRASLILDALGSLYGTTRMGGSGGWGTVFRLDGPGSLTTLHNFDFSDGANPEAALIFDALGNLYEQRQAEQAAAAPFLNSTAPGA